MGLFFCLLYIVTAYLTPTVLFGDLAELRLELIFGVIALFVTVLLGQRSGALSWIQTWAVLGLGLGAALSISLNGWMGGGLYTITDFAPILISFFLVAVNVNTRLRLQIFAGALFLVALFMIYHGWDALRTPEIKSTYLLDQGFDTADGEHQSIWRIRGAGLFNDPNDMAQFLVSLLPCLFFLWTKGSSLRNFLLVYLPAGVLLYGMYLTHSRGCMVALMAMAAVAARRKIGLVPSAVLAGVLFIGMSAVGFSGGRDVSAGEDRIEAWSTGLNLIRSNPVFGVGFEHFSDHNEITAHNSIVVTAAELGLVGFFFWIMLITVSVRNAYVGEGVPKPKKADDMGGLPLRFGAPTPTDYAVSPMQANTIAPAGNLHFLSMHLATPRLAVSQALETNTLKQPLGFEVGKTGQSNLTEEESQRMSRLMLISLSGMLTAGWFLSRSYSILVYVNTGMAMAIYQMARKGGFAPPPMPNKVAVKASLATGLALLMLVYLIVRVDHLMPH